MNAVQIGPVVLAIERFAALAGVAVFLIAVALLARRGTIGPALRSWSANAVIFGFVAARAGHVLAHWQSFSAEPWRILAVWQGGFSAQGAVVAVVLFGEHIRHPMGPAGDSETWSQHSSSR